MAADNLERIGNTWYASMHVPPDVREELGKSRLKKTLKTADKRVAIERARIIIAEWWRDILRARRSPSTKLSPLTSEALIWRESIKKSEAQPSKDEDDIDDRDLLSDRVEQIEEKHGSEAASAFAAVALGKKTPLLPLIDQWATYTGKTVKGKTLTMYKADTLRLSQSLQNLEDLTHRNVRDWLWGLAANTGDGMSEGNQRRILNGLSSFWRWCYAQNLIEEAASNPFIGQPVHRGAVQTKRIPFTADEVVDTWSKALEKDDQPLADLIYFAAYTGARIEELCLVQSKDVSPNGSSFKIPDAKTGAGVREVPVHSMLKATIQRLIGDTTDGYLIKSTAKNTHDKRSDPLGKRFGRLKDGLGFGPERVFHSIRKTVATQLENAGIAEGVAADILGHEKQTMTYGLYSGGTSLENKARAIEALSFKFLKQV